MPLLVVSYKMSTKTLKQSKKEISTIRKSLDKETQRTWDLFKELFLLTYEIEGSSKAEKLLNRAKKVFVDVSK